MALDIMIGTVNSVLLKEVGWVDIEPGSYVYTVVDFYNPPVNNEPQHTGATFIGFSFKELTSQKIRYVPTESILAISRIEDEEE